MREKATTSSTPVVVLSARSLFELLALGLSLTLTSNFISPFIPYNSTTAASPTTSKSTLLQIYALNFSITTQTPSITPRAPPGGGGETITSLQSEPENDRSMLAGHPVEKFTFYGGRSIAVHGGLVYCIVSHQRGIFLGIMCYGCRLGGLR